MPNQITAAGIEINSYSDIINYFTYGNTQTPGLVVIYGPDINLDPNSPDGQWLNLLALANEDILQFSVGLYGSMNPDTAIGIALDGISQLNAITRKGGTYTQTEVVVTTNASVTLNGLDNSQATAFQVQDGNGNILSLINTVSIGSGANTLNFQAVNMGFVQIVQNTVTVIVTPQSGVIAVNNPNPPYAFGANQETDAQFRLRRQQSTAGVSTHKAQALQAALNNIVGVEQAIVNENNTKIANALGVPPNSIWVIVEGGGIQNLINDGAFALWDSSTQLSDWVTEAGTLARITSPVYSGAYSAGITSTGSLAYISQSYLGFSLLLGQTITLGGWVWCATPGIAYLLIYDGTGYTQSSFHPGDSQWHYLTVEHTIALNANQLDFDLNVMSTGVAYFDNASAYQGSTTNTLTETIAEMIYNYVDCIGMKGSTVIPIVQNDGTIFPVYFDVAQQQVLYINLNIESLVGGVVNNTAIQNFLIQNYVLGINEVADITSITALIKEYNPNLLVTSAGVSVDNSNFFKSILPSQVQNYFVLLLSNIIITNT